MFNFFKSKKDNVIFKENIGFVNGKHYTEYVEVVEKLKRENKFNEAEKLLLEIIEAIEYEAKVEKCGVAPWYYEQLAIIYRKQKEKQNEINILERFMQQNHALGVKPAKLRERLEKLKSE